MKKKLSLISLNSDELKKEDMSRLHAGVLESEAYEVCASCQCTCFCSSEAGDVNTIAHNKASKNFKDKNEVAQAQVPAEQM